MSFDDFKKYLIKDSCSSWSVDEAPYVYSPRKDTDNPKHETRLSGYQRQTGRCVFLENERCKIHEVKPYECKNAFACNFTRGMRDKIEQKYRDAGYPLGDREE